MKEDKRISWKAAFKLITKSSSLMDIAQDEIKIAQNKYPKRKKLIDKSFLLLKPQFKFRNKMMESGLYRDHCKEILGRVAKRDKKKLSKGSKCDTRLATRAEIILILSEFSIDKPLNDISANLYSRLFIKAFKDNKTKVLGKESYPGEARELYIELKEKFKVKERINL